MTDYHSILSYILENGTYDADGVLHVPNDNTYALSRMMGELYPFRPWKRYGKDRKHPQEDFRAYTPVVGTPEFHAAQCFHLARFHVLPGGLLSEQRFPPEAIRHLQLAAGEPKADEEHKTETPVPDKGKRTRLEWLADALLTYHQHPKWSMRRIARAVEVDVGTLSRCDEFKAALKLPVREPPPRGSKHAKTGDIEAVSG